MKNIIKQLRTIALLAIAMLTIIACGPPRLKGTVTIEGDPLLGNTLTANFDALGGSGIISYQWIRGGGTVISTDSPTYTLQDDDKDAVITVTVTRSDNSGSVTSAPVKAYYGYYIGDTGPGGGIIFYRNPDSFTMTDTGETAHYLEAAPVNQGNLAWASANFTATDISGTETDIGTGRKNTVLILAVDSNAPAALACNNYTNNGMNDWFLPSRDELNELYRQKNHLGISSGYFWSSSQSFSNGARYQYFDYGDRSDNLKYVDTFNVRAIRAF